MKDKLVKNNHRGSYYRAKAFFLSFVIFATAITIAVIPTYIAIKGNSKEPTHATVEEEEETPIEEEARFLSYDK
ncbi:MAG: hypothetical protein K6C32_02425 [Bacilli bacterium]|nr:hypothetical protein [Bacilli bacterium]